MSAELSSPTYKQLPRPVGFEIAYSLEGETLVVDTLRKIDRVDLRTVEQLRLTFEPKSFVNRVFRLTLRLRDGKKLSFSSITWRSMIDARPQNDEYRAFAQKVIEAVAKANPNARFICGKPLLLWGLIVMVTAATLLTIAAFSFRALQLGSLTTALFGSGVLALGIWQLEPFVRLNRPAMFTPDQPPPALLP
jgi:hypothetical protein